MLKNYVLCAWKKRLFTTWNIEKKKPDRKSGKPYKYTSERVKELLNKSLASDITEYSDSCRRKEALIKSPWLEQKKKNKMKLY